MSDDKEIGEDSKNLRRVKLWQKKQKRQWTTDWIRS